MENRRQWISLRDIICSFDSFNELQTWAQENQLLNHPWVQQRLDNILDVVSGFTDVIELTQCALDNAVLNHERVINRINTLLT